MGWFKKKEPEIPLEAYDGTPGSGMLYETPQLTWHVPEGTDEFLIPKRATPGAMAYDLVCPTDVTLVPGTNMVTTLVAVTLPPGYAMVLGSRSSFAAKRRLTVEAGWIDNDYRGIIKVVLYNHSDEEIKINSGERIAQARLVKIADMQEDVVYQYPDPDETTRGAGGFGSTGK